MAQGSRDLLGQNLKQRLTELEQGQYDESATEPQPEYQMAVSTGSRNQEQNYSADHGSDGSVADHEQESTQRQAQDATVVADA